MWIQRFLCLNEISILRYISIQQDIKNTIRILRPVAIWT